MESPIERDIARELPNANASISEIHNQDVIVEHESNTMDDSATLNSNTIVIGFRILDSVWRILWLELAILSFLTLVIAVPILRTSYSGELSETSIQLKDAFDKALFLYLPVRLLVAVSLLCFSRFSTTQRPSSRSSAGIENLLTFFSVVITYISTIYLRSRGEWDRPGNDPEFFAKKVVGSAMSATGGRLNGLESVQADVGLTVVIAVGFLLIFIATQVLSCAPCLFLLRMIRNRRAD